MKIHFYYIKFCELEIKCARIFPQFFCVQAIFIIPSLILSLTKSFIVEFLFLQNRSVVIRV